MVPPRHVRVLRPDEGDLPRCSPLHLELESGDALLIDVVDGAVLITLDDSDETPLPTGRLTGSEALRLAAALFDAERQCREFNGGPS